MKYMFWIATGLIVYTYAGYPAWLWLRGRWRTRPTQRAPITPFVSIVMVARNEAGRLEEKLRNLMALNYPQDRFQIVAVSDGSVDGTDELLTRWAESSRVIVCHSPVARGKAAGLNDAFAVVQGDIILLTDVRQKLEPDCLRLLLENFADEEVGCVSGELMLGHPGSGEVLQGLGLYWQIEKKIRELESISGSVIGATGAVYAARRNLIEFVPPGITLDDVYLPMQIVRQGKRVLFDARARAWDIPDQGTGREFARKVRTLLGNYELVQIMPWLLSANNPVRFEFISHKLLRLSVPFALIATLVSSAFLSGPFYRAAFALQIMFYTLSLLALTHIKLGALAHAADAAFSFVMLNTAAAMAFLHFVSGRKPVWGR